MNDLLDRYLAGTVYEGHQTNQPEDPDRPDNLFHPLPGDHGAHGPFDAEARPRSSGGVTRISSASPEMVNMVDPKPPRERAISRPQYPGEYAMATLEAATMSSPAR